jgi:RNA 3'-terminal phosphate cyclase (ATP)
MLVIDGAMGEGGGQILRSSLSLSLCLGKSFRIVNLRAARRRPGLRPQHLAALRAAQALSGARVRGDAIGSSEVEFAPGPVRAGEYQFDVGTAGSTTLVAQTILPALMAARAPSCVAVEGGTHNPLAPPYEFLALAYLPLVEDMGPRLRARLVRPGFYPAGGGRIELEIEPAMGLGALGLESRGALRSLRACALLAHLPQHIAQRELDVIGAGLGLAPSALEVRRLDEARGPGNLAQVVVESEHVVEVFTSFGERGLPAEEVARRLVSQARRYLAAEVPIGEQLADQLVLLLGLAREGRFLTLAPSRHTTTNIAVVEAFTGLRIGCRERAPDCWEIAVTRT